MRWEVVLEYLKPELAAQGLTIAEPFALQWYNSSLPSNLGAAIPETGPAGPNSLTVLVGNTKELWLSFLDACRKDTKLAASNDPLDTYVTCCVAKAVAALPEGSRSPRVYYSHQPASDLEGGATYVAMQRMAEAIGLAYLDPISHLCLHPKYGPWLSLRAALVFSDVEYTGPRSPPVTNPMDVKTERYVKLVAMSARRSNSISGAPGTGVGSSDLMSTSLGSISARGSASLASLLGGGGSSVDGGGGGGGSGSYSSPSLLGILSGTMSGGASSEDSDDGEAGSGGAGGGGALQMAPSSLRAASLPIVARTPASGAAVVDGAVGQFGAVGHALRTRWEKWVAVRDAPCPGHPRRFYKDQVEYHYTQSRAVLERALAAVPSSSHPAARQLSRASSTKALPWVLCSSAEPPPGTSACLTAGC